MSSEAKRAYRREYMRNYYHSSIERSGKVKATIKQRRITVQAWMLSLKIGKSCKCGESDHRCLDWHHKDPATKTTPRGGISQVVFKLGWSQERILEELTKCDIFCANCHRAEHISDTPSNKGIPQRKPVPTNAELAAMSKSRRHYWRNQAASIDRKNARIAETIEWYRNLKAGCQSCSENRPPCLDFHHRDQTTKTQNISKLVYRGLTRSKLLAEIAKCDLLCANCHRKLDHKPCPNP